MTVAQRVAARYAKEVNYRDFSRLMQWLGPKAYAAHKKFPDGFRFFDTTTREFRFNIDPKDYLSYDIEEAKRMMAEGAMLQEVVNPVAYRAMKDVIEALRKRNIQFNMTKVPWTEGGSYITATFPKPNSSKAPQERYALQLRRRVASSLTREDVVRVLLAQPGNQGKSAEHLSDRWVASDRFTLTTVHAHLPDLGVTEGKTGESHTSGPIIVDDNLQGVARYGGNFGAAPDFLVLDGQNRVVAARRKGPRTMLPAYVGDKVLSALRRKDDDFAEKYKDLQAVIDEYLATTASPGRLLTRLKEYVRIGLLTQDELSELRAQWKATNAPG